MKKRILFSLLIFIILLELSCRVFLIAYSYRINGKFYGFSKDFFGYVRQYLKFSRYEGTIIEDKFGRRIYKPGLKDSLIETNSFGMPDKEINPTDSGIYRVLCVGSSYTNTGSSGKRFTNYLEEELNRNCPRPEFEIINGGVSGARIVNSFMNYALLWKELRPDMVIIDNVLDDAEVIPFYLKSYTGAKKTQDSCFWDAAINYIAICRTYDIFITHGPSRKISKPTEEMLDYYESSLEAFIFLCKGSGTKVVLLSCGITIDESHDFEKDNPKIRLLESRDTLLSADGTIRTITEYNKIMQRVAQKHNIIFIDMKRLMPKDDSYFVDATHRSDKGNEIFADILARELLKKGAFN